MINLNAAANAEPSLPSDLRIRSRADLSAPERVSLYLESTKEKFEPGSAEYYARVALAQALEAYKEGNYGIGAVALLVGSGSIFEFRGRNNMMGGLGLHDHAEARALEDLLTFKRNLFQQALPPAEVSRTALVKPTDAYVKDLNGSTAKLGDGVHIFGTLEPCPMCMVMILNAGVASSTSTVLDGVLREFDDGQRSDGAATCIGDKARLLPEVWRGLMKQRGFEFKLLDTADLDLKFLSDAIFLETRAALDQKLTQKGGGS